ncbi:DUF6141 family protein [Halorussus litoreus]|uniref:DUF6141 family protein n=1 Tax=Halorussus litoreus TaxID=1710536 RepID=UPI000E26CA6E|nr:DUF6141 family protein [Halorussus litoreus]
METEVHFRETQQFRQRWLWALLGLQAIVAIVRLARGTRSTRETAADLVLTVSAALLFRVATLSTEVRDDGIYVKFAPLHRKYRRIPFSDLAEVQSTGYSPLRYGGWGIRWSPSGMAYTVSGKTGIRFERTGGKSVFVGSDRPEEFVAAVQDASSQTV